MKLILGWIGRGGDGWGAFRRRICNLGGDDEWFKGYISCSLEGESNKKGKPCKTPWCSGAVATLRLERC